MYNQIDSNKRKTIFLIASFIVFLALVGYLYGYINGYGYTGLILALIISTVWTLISWYAGSAITLATLGAHELKDKSQFPTLWNTVENLSITAGIPMPRIFIVNDTSPNAFATGRDPQHASVAVTTGLLQILNKTELEGVLAHELAHIKNYDTRIMVFIGVLVGAIVMLGDWMFRSSLLRSNDRKNGHPAIMIIGLLFIILSPIIAELIKLAISRSREYMADASGALLTRYPEGLASALEKIRDNATPMRQQSQATNHLWISDPKAKKLSEKISGFFATHPPINDRINKLRGMLNNP